MLEIKEISKSYGAIKALNNISLTINKGDIFGLLGPNGAGKSTLLNILSCITTPDFGNILLNEENIEADADEYRRQIGVVPQEIALYQELSANDNLFFWGSLYDIPQFELKERADHVLNILGIYERRNHKIKTYSGGMKRKINIACSILHNPSLLLMDEPTVGLDPQSRYDILDVIETLNAKGITIIYTTHHMEVAERLCNKIAVIDSGNVLAQGSISDLSLTSKIKDSIVIKLKNVKTLTIDKLSINSSSCKIDSESNTLYLECDNINNDITNIINNIQKCSGEIVSIETRAVDLESIFMKLTGKKLRD